MSNSCDSAGGQKNVSPSSLERSSQVLLLQTAGPRCLLKLHKAKQGGGPEPACWFIAEVQRATKCVLVCHRALQGWPDLSGREKDDWERL